MADAISQDWIVELIAIVEEAGAAILEVYNTDFEIQSKSDESPLTQADLAAHRVIVAGLKALSPQIPIISEESAPPAFSERAAWQRYWLVDPLDGTKEFVNRNGEFTVNIALIDGSEPVFGIVGVPQEKVYIGDVRQNDPGQRAYVVHKGESQPLQVQRGVIAKGLFVLWRAATTVASGWRLIWARSRRALLTANERPSAVR